MLQCRDSETSDSDAPVPAPVVARVPPLVAHDVDELLLSSDSSQDEPRAKRRCYDVKVLMRNIGRSHLLAQN